MKLIQVFISIAALLTIASCRPAAPPVTEKKKPISINDVPLKDAPRQPMKPVSEMNWTTFDGKVQKLKDF
ncbi:MAG TPA: hypothetical protein DDW24_06615, partial [Blastocatellia bacterium]|nr:hypothetical protein [Blastocatellia bacterium]